MNDFTAFLLMAILALGIIFWTTYTTTPSWLAFADDKPTTSWGNQNKPCANITDRSKWMEYNDVLTDDGGFICNFKYCTEDGKAVDPDKCGYKSSKPKYSGCYKNNTSSKVLTMDPADCNQTAWGVKNVSCSSIPDTDKRKWIEHADIIKDDKSRECWFRYVSEGAYRPKIDTKYLGCFYNTLSGEKCKGSGKAP